MPSYILSYLFLHFKLYIQYFHALSWTSYQLLEPYFANDPCLLYRCYHPRIQVEGNKFH